MSRSARTAAILAVFLASTGTASARQAKMPPLARIVWLEPAGNKPQERGQLQVYREISANDPRLKDFERWVDTEATRFARRLVYRAAERFGVDAGFREPVLPIVIRKGGNNPGFGLALERSGGAVEEHPKLGFVILDPSPSYLGDTLLHEAGHVVHGLAAAGRGGERPWSAFPHTTFAISDPLTALSEGYGIHFETLWGHFGSDGAKQAYYRHLAPSFEANRGRSTHYFAAVDDLLNFAQAWSRYQAVRDSVPAFEGHVYSGLYPRSQMDPERDCARLKSANAMVASEGVVASVFFWIVAGIAGEQGARAGGGLDQPAILDAEMVLLEALAATAQNDAAAFRPDVIDVIDALARRGSQTRDVAISRFVDVTRGVTARPAIRNDWRTLYGAAITLDIGTVKGLLARLDAERGEIVEQARRDITSLRAGVGPVVPVRVKDQTFQLKAFGEPQPIEFDLNGMSDADIALLKGLDADARARVERERERAPFASTADFTARTGLSLERLGLVRAEMSGTQ